MSEDSRSESPYKPNESPDNTGSDRGPAPTVWLPGAIGIVALMWFLLTVPARLAPLTLVHFMSMQLGPPLCAFLLILWWMTSRRLPLRHRWVGLGLGLGALLFAMFAGHPSLRVILLVYGLPIALTILVAGFVVAAKAGWPRRGWIAWTGYTVFWMTTLLFRIDGMDASFAFSLVPRWEPTAEAEFLAGLESQASSEESIDGSPPVSEIGAEDWAEFRGPDRDGVVRDVSFATDWEAAPPRELWRRPVGPGWSSLCVVGDWLFTQEQRGEIEVVAAYSSITGAPLWTNETEGRFEASMGGVGPRATPTYRDGRLYVTGGAGLVQCLNANSGESLWNYHLIDDFGSTLPAWGFASSPLVLGELVYVFAGGGEGKGLVALRRESGELVWSAENGSHGYCSPQLSTIDGVEQILISSNVGVTSLNPADGEQLWHHEWDISQFPRVTQPLVVGNQVFLGTGYGNGTRRIDVSLQDGKWTEEDQWTARLKPYFNDFVHYQGHLYGFDGEIFMSVDVEEGERNWKRGRYGNGQVLLIDEMGLLLVISEKGDLILLDADPEEHHEIAKIPSVEGITWNHPVIANGKLFVRNVREMVCYELKPVITSDTPAEGTQNASVTE
ncbi:MAG: PQQ-binding-like beta-propeller repeat protein [Planctomycetota bacterium]